MRGDQIAGRSRFIEMVEFGPSNGVACVYTAPPDQRLRLQRFGGRPCIAFAGPDGFAYPMNFLGAHPRGQGEPP